MTIEAPPGDRVPVTTRRRARRQAAQPDPGTLLNREPANPPGDEPHLPPLAAELHEPGDPATPIPADEWTPGWRPWPPGQDQRWCLYFIYGRLPARTVWWLRLYDRAATALLGPQSYLLYIGQTGQYVPLARGLNHVIRKSWAPDIRSIEVGTATYASEAAAEAVEAREIRRRRPVHNIAHNVGNPRAADSTLRRPPHHQRRARRQAMRRLVWRVGGTGLLWWVLASLAPHINALHRLFDSAGGRLMVVAWAAMVVFGAGRVGRAARR